MAFDLGSVLDNLLEDPWFQLTFLLTVALFASFLFVRFGQPKVIGYIIIGVVIGPSVLNIIKLPEVAEDVPGEVISAFPAEMQMLALLGSIVLLFMIGLECDFREVFTRRPVAIAVGGVLLPWGAGFAVAHLMGYGAYAVFIGAALVATSVAVTASVMSELGVIGTSVANAIVGAAVVDDILGMIVLGISKGLAKGNLEVLGVMALMIGAIVFVVIGYWIGARILAKFVFSVQIRGYRRKMPMSGFILALAIAFLYAFIAEAIGISAIVGAFVAGTAFSGSALRDGFRKGTQYLDALFVPLFFVSLGVVVDIGAMYDALALGLALTAVAFASKIAGCGLPAYWTGMSKWDSVAIGLGMAPRLEIALIIAFYGLSNEIIGHDVYSVVVFMGLVTALLTPPFLKRSLVRAGHSFTIE